MKYLRSLISHPGGAILSGFFLTVMVGPLHASFETYPPDSWVYPALRTFELLGLVQLEPIIPYSRDDIEFYLNRVLSGIDTEKPVLTARQCFLLDRLKEEFLGKASRPHDREDRPVYLYRQGDRFFSFDLSTGVAFVKSAEEEKGEVDGLAFPSVLIDFGKRVTLETSYRITLAPERGSNVHNRKPSARVKSFRGVTVEYERALLSLRGSRWKIRLGRDYMNWGSGRSEGLLLSQTAGSLDHLAVDLSMGRFRLSTIHTILDPQIPRFLAGHRLTVRLPRGIYIGIGETVLYAGRDFDLVYLLPVTSYYVTQFNERGDDNVLWSIDWKIPLRRGFIVYGEFLVDDFQYEKDPPAPHRLGMNLTAEALITVFGREIELLCGYTYIDIFTYAHKDSLLTRYVTGNGDRALNNIIGSPLGPDADRWNLSVSIPVHPRIALTLGARVTRRGEGSNLREWDRIEDPHPPFPSGAVVREKEISLDQVIDLGRGSFIAACGGWRSLSGANSLNEQKEGFAHLRLVMDF